MPNTLAGMVQTTINAALQIQHPIVTVRVVFGASYLSTRQTNSAATRKISPSGQTRPKLAEGMTVDLEFVKQARLSLNRAQAVKTTVAATQLFTVNR